MSDIILSAGTLFSKAKSFYKSSQYKQLDFKRWDQSDALAAIVFSALSIEAFLNELPALANQRVEEDAQNLIREIQPLIVKRKKTVIKFLKSSQCTSDAPLNTDVQSYKDVELLIDLRNTIVHLKAGDTLSGRLEDHKKILERLQDTGVSIDAFTIKPENSNDEFHFPFIALISTQVVAEWSCNVVADVINFLVDGMRESEFKKLLKSYMGSFEPVCKIPESELVRWHGMIFSHDCNNLEELLEKIKSGQLIVTKPTQENKKVTLSCYIFNFLSKFKRFIKWGK